ncbi:tetratricopeptide repeat protein [Candidatus Laterigemmans baculatus]|uniref:tetratricopeptide repeat protein n=1 Tax=Candidatus Laterigemmans baculatus TaxID=2770505 RepID=UPI0013D910ED|nr:hypothetical protein [Candidatus Laterigemmans baculatus]
MSKALAGCRIGSRVLILPTVLLTALWTSTAQAQLDRVYPTTGSTITGEITDVRRDGVVVKVGSQTQNVRLDEIRKINFEGDPPELTRGRDLAVDGQYQSALEELRQVDLGAIRRDYINADALFFRALSEAQLALAGQGSKEEAVKVLRAFAQKHPQSMHFYKAAELLGDLAVATGNYEAAGRFYSSLGSSTIPLLKVRAVYLAAVASLRQGNDAEAISGLDKVIGANLESAEAARLKTLARAQRAIAQAREGKGQEALQAVDAMVAELNPSDAEVAARIYNARGAAHVALGDDEAALLDYLHTHLLFSSVADAHAEALTQLVQLWPKVGKPERAAEARQELQSRYPGWGG